MPGLRIMYDPPSAAERPECPTSGWWIVLDYVEHPMAYGPYESEDVAIAAMESSLLIDAQCCDTKYPDTLDDVYVPDRPGTVAGMCEAYGPEYVLIIDPNDPDHFAPPED